LKQNNVRRFVALVLLVLILASGGATAAVRGVRPQDSTAVVPQVTVQPEASGLTALVGPGIVPGPNAVMNLTSDELHLLAHIISGEARGESFEGQVAVGAVVLNRVRDRELGTTVAEVIYRPGQFEPVRNGQINIDPSESCVKAALAAAAGWDPTDGALYFWQPEQTWSEFLWSRPFKAQIGCHRFTG